MPARVAVSASVDDLSNVRSTGSPRSRSPDSFWTSAPETGRSTKDTSSPKSQVRSPVRSQAGDGAVFFHAARASESMRGPELGDVLAPKATTLPTSSTSRQVRRRWPGTASGREGVRRDVHAAFGIDRRRERRDHRPVEGHEAAGEPSGELRYRPQLAPRQPWAESWRSDAILSHCHAGSRPVELPRASSGARAPAEPSRVIPSSSAVGSKRYATRKRHAVKGERGHPG